MVNFDETEYLQAMKRFQVKTRGMLKDSPEYTQVRNAIYSELRRAKASFTNKERAELGGQTVTETSVKADFSSFFNLLIVDPADPDSMETLAILNYFNFPMEVEEDTLDGISRKEMGFKKDDAYPLLVIDSSSAEMPSASLSHRDNILTFLFNRSIIGTYKQHSVYEKQGLEFAEAQLKPALENLLLDFRSLSQMYLVSKNFKQSKTVRSPF